MRSRTWKWLPVLAALSCAILAGLTCMGLDGGEFEGGLLTGKLLRMALMGTVLFLVAAPLAAKWRGAAVACCLAATCLSAPLYAYLVYPGAFQVIFDATPFSVADPGIHWNNDAVLGLVSLTLWPTACRAAWARAA